ncbi:MAG: hypothetical protein KGJ97_02455 [Xanthomonadaceae bacterium]|jgi:hypothetical protein|nr:hypothetical protein [Xanthomonadaceae bacterium]MDE3071576.1 hypothetical protein [Pseudomonadota bacterium]
MSALTYVDRGVYQPVLPNFGHPHGGTLADNFNAAPAWTTLRLACAAFTAEGMERTERLGVAVHSRRRTTADSNKLQM